MTNAEQALYLINNRHGSDFEELQARVRAQIGEPVICKHFGCGRTLSLEESRFGNYCVKHGERKSIDLMKVIKYK